MDLPALIDSLAARRGPVLTWYGQERTELGGAVAARWLAKTANLLAGDLAGDLFDDPRDESGPDSADEEGPAPLGTIRVDLGCGWQSVTWLLAAWLSGWRSVGSGTAGTDEGDAAALVDARASGTASGDTPSGDTPSSPDVWVVDTVTPAAVDAATRGCWVLAQATTPLALSWPGDLPEGVLDALSELSAQSDALEIAPDVSPDLVIVGAGAGTDLTPRGTALLTVRDLSCGDGRSHTHEATDQGPARVLVTSSSPVEDARTVLAHWSAGSSVVMVDPRLNDDRDRLRITRAERVTREV